MSFLGKLFWNKNPKKSKYLQEKKESIEISFAKKFTSNGGKFLYCENEEDLKSNFQNILIENKISNSEIFSFEKSFSDYICYNDKFTSPRALLVNCEFLISDQGSIMVSNHQILEKKLDQLPEILIIMAENTNFKNDVSEAMSAIKNKYGKSIPTNITNIYPKNPKKSNFISYRRTSKELYLLLRDFNK